MRCGFKYKPGTLFCEGCGTRLNSTAEDRKIYDDLGLEEEEAGIMVGGVYEDLLVPSVSAW